MSLSREGATRSLLGLPFQGEEKNVDVLVQQLDGVAGIFPKALLACRGLSVPQACLRLGGMDSLSDQLDSLIQIALYHHGDLCC